MSKAYAIFRKELKIYFGTPVAYVIFGVFAAIAGYFFFQILSFFERQQMQLMQMQGQQAQVTQLLERMNLNDMVIIPIIMNVNVFFLLMIPVLTMRLIAEEKRTRTMELLATNPVTVWQIVIGKYLASVVVVLAMTGIIALYPVLIALVSGGQGSGGGIEWAPVITGLMGLFLAGASFAAIGLFASSLSESQILSAIVGFGILLLFWVIGWAAGSAEGVTKDVLQYVSFIEHMVQFTKGLLELKDVVFYLSVIFLSLFLTTRVVDSQRWR
ncbi:MAG: ABC transporter permease subunit [Myxococcota bacterium]|jgi:ABC-2 type transport system permease protein